MSAIEQARQALVHRVLDGDGYTSRNERENAFNNKGLSGASAALVDRVVQGVPMVSEIDIKAARSSGLSEEQIFEIVVCAAIGQGTRQYESAMTALKAALEKE
jgi:hypothetical protein